ncbi:zinc ribbon-containing protein [Culicoidibacter larvae]
MAVLYLAGTYTCVTCGKKHEQIEKNKALPKCPTCGNNTFTRCTGYHPKDKWIKEENKE